MDFKKYLTGVLNEIEEKLNEKLIEYDTEEKSYLLEGVQYSLEVLKQKRDTVDSLDETMIAKLFTIGFITDFIVEELQVKMDGTDATAEAGVERSMDVMESVIDNFMRDIKDEKGNIKND